MNLCRSISSLGNSAFCSGSGRSGLAVLFADALIMVCFAFFAIAACKGVLAISAGGTELDSDLKSYIQGLVAANNVTEFVADPFLSQIDSTKYTANALCAFANLLCPEDPARGILLAGGYVVFLHFVSFYLLGRSLFARPSLALLLSLLSSGITVWIEWGTFWGGLQSDPVPRSLFAALWPFVLIAAIHGMDRQWPRPLVMLACGLGIYVNPVNSLACGAMFFAAFFFNRVPGDRGKGKKKFSSHLFCLGVSLLLFLFPVFYFLWPAFNSKSLSPEEVAILRQVFDLRLQENFGQFGARLLHLVTPSSEFFLLPVLIPGIFCWFVVARQAGRQKGKIPALTDNWRRLFALTRMYPFFLLGLCFVVFASLAEAALLPSDRFPQGHELVRCLRYLIPLSWIMIAAVIAMASVRLPAVVAWLAPAIALGLILGCASDRQLMGVNYTLARLTGIETGLSRKADELAHQAMAKRKMIEKLALTVPKGELVYATSDGACVRYIAHLPVVPNFRDGFIIFYDRNIDLSRKWLEWRALEKEKLGYLKVWEKSGAIWMLTDRVEDLELLASKAEIVWQEADRILVKAR